MTDFSPKTTVPPPTLAQRMDLPPAAFLKKLLRLTECLETLHQNGFLCLNLSPDTVLCRDDGAVLPKEPHSLIPSSAFLRGEQPQFVKSLCCAPEVLRYSGEYLERRRFAKIGHRADVFSVGMLLYLYLTEVPSAGTITGRQLQSVYGAILSGEFTVRREDIPDAVRPQLARLLREALAYFAGDRLADMAQLSKRLRDILALFPD